jgi:hypothetical protein
MPLWHAKRGSQPPNPPFQPTAARKIEGILTGMAVRLRRLNGNPLGGLNRASLAVINKRYTFVTAVLVLLTGSVCLFLGVAKGRVWQYAIYRRESLIPVQKHPRIKSCAKGETETCFLPLR